MIEHKIFKFQNDYFHHWKLKLLTLKHMYWKKNFSKLKKNYSLCFNEFLIIYSFIQKMIKGNAPEQLVDQCRQCNCTCDLPVGPKGDKGDKGDSVKVHNK